jgi:hypothetical protein
MQATRTITNNFTDWQLLNLAPERGHPDQRGPYMISQEGAAPDDPHFRHCAFVMTRRGTWLHHFILFHLDPAARARVAEFDSATEIIRFAEELTGPVRVETPESLRAWLETMGFATALDEAGLEAERARRQAQATSQ